MNSQTDQIEFPPEIAIFADRIDDQWIGKIQTALTENQKTIPLLKLSDWHITLQDLCSQEKQLPSEVWAMNAKLAWIQADVSFFIRNSDMIDNITDNPLFLCYFGAGFAELIDFEKGFKLMQEAVFLAKSKSDWYALIDMIIPYGIVLSNSENKEELNHFNRLINQVIVNELNSNPHYQSLVRSLCFFSGEETDASENGKTIELLQASLSNGHHLNSALLYNQLSKKNDEYSYKRNMKNAIRQLLKINAKLRLLIAYTNFGIFYASKADYKKSEEYFDQAFAIIKEVSLSKRYGSGLYVYPLTEKARIYVERGKLQEAQETYQIALEKANNYNNPLYKVRTNFGLAYSFFFLQQYDLAYNHAKEALLLSEGLHDPQFRDSCKLKYADILRKFGYSQVETPMDLPMLEIIVAAQQDRLKEIVT